MSTLNNQDQLSYSERKEHRRVQFANRDIFFAAARHYFLAAVLLGVFSYIYERNSHGVYTPYMTCLALIPFLLGALPMFLMGTLDAVSNHHIIRISPMTRVLWTCGVMTLSMGSAVMGALIIYGTSTDYMIAYPVAGGILMFSAVIGLIRNNSKSAWKEKWQQERSRKELFMRADPLQRS